MGIVAGPVRIAILADARPAVQGFHQVESEASGMGSKLGGIGKGIAGAFAGMAGFFAVDKIAEGFKEVVSQAADLSNAVGATKQVFGSSSADMVNWSKTASTTLGLSQSEALNATKVFGGFFTAVGMNTTQADKMSKSWTTMAGNLAAFGDMPTADAIDAVTGALRGEYDPLQRYIPTISAAAIQQKAMAMSGVKNAKSLTQQQNAAAINALIMDSVANKAGAAERAQGGYAVQMEKIKAQVKDAAAALGSVFLPALTSGMKFINETGIPAVKKFGELVGPKLKGLLSGIGRFQPPKAIIDIAQSQQAQSIITNFRNGFVSLGPIISKVFNTVAPIIRQVAQTLGTAFSAAVPKIKAIFGTIGAIVGQVFDLLRVQVTNVVTVIQFLWKNFGSNILQYISTAFGAVVSILQGAFTIIKGIFDIVIGLLTGNWSRAWDGVKTVFQGAWQVIQGIWQAIQAEITLVMAVIGKVLSAGWAAIVGEVSTAWNFIRGLIVGAWNGIKAGVSAAANFVKSLISAAWNGIKAATAAIWHGITAFFNLEWTGIKIIFNAAVSAVKTVISGAWNAIHAVTSTVWNAIKSFFSSVWAGIRAVVSGAVNGLKSVMSSAWSAITSAVTAAWNGIKNAVTSGIGNVVSTVRSLPGKIKGAVSGAASWLYNVGRDVIQGLLNGIGSMIGAVADKVRSVVNGAISAGKSLLGIKSPSTVFHEMGVQTFAGYINGLTAGYDASKSSVDKIFKGLIKGVADALPEHIKKTFPKGTKASVIAAWQKAEEAAAKVRGAKRDALTAYIQKNNAALLKMVQQRDDIASKLKDANANVADLQKQRADVVSNIADSFIGTFKLINDSADAGIASIDDILQRSRDAVTLAGDFAAQLKTLSSRGVDPAILQELATAGPQAGLDTAKALASASDQQLKELSDNYKQIAASGQAAGNAVAGRMYDTGIAAAQAIADGFAAQQAQIEASMVATINKVMATVAKAISAAPPTPIKAPVVKAPAVKAPAKTTVVQAAVMTTKVVPAVTATAVAPTPIQVTVNTGAVVDKRGLVDTISAAFNEVSGLLGRPITMNVAR